MGEEVFWLTFGLPVVFMIGGVLIILMAMRQRSLTLEMKHRERMAMIEKGLLPSPGQDPAAFESWQQQHDNPPARATSIGVVIVALGLGLMLLIGFAGNEGDIALGVGGAIVVVGAAFIVNGMLTRRPPPPGFPPRRPDPAGPLNH